MMNTLCSAMRISSSGMTAERFRMDVISSNIANANTVETATSQPYRRKSVALAPDAEGVRIVGVVDDPREFPLVPDPNNPDRRIRASNVNPIEEMVSMIAASRAYEANIAAFNSAKSMMRNALNIGKI